MRKKLTRDQEILEIATGYTILMLSKSLQRSVSIRKGTSRIEQSWWNGKEVEDLLSKGAITLIDQEDQFLSTLFLALKKDGNQRPVINLK